MDNKYFLNYEQSSKMKEIGFDEPCFFAFDNCEMRCSDLRTNKQQFEGVNYNSGSYTSQPTYEQAFDWIGRKYEIFSTVLTRTKSIFAENVRTYYDTLDTVWIYNHRYQLTNIWNDTRFVSADSYTYTDIQEEAYKRCFDRAIDLVKEKINGENKYTEQELLDITEDDLNLWETNINKFLTGEKKDDFYSSKEESDKNYQKKLERVNYIRNFKKENDKIKS